MKRVRKAAGKPLGHTSVFDLILRGTPVGICNCSYTYTHTHTHSSTDTCIHNPVETHLYRHLYTCICTNRYIYIYLYSHTKDIGWLEVIYTGGVG